MRYAIYRTEEVNERGWVRWRYEAASVEWESELKQRGWDMVETGDSATVAIDRMHELNRNAIARPPSVTAI